MIGILMAKFKMLVRKPWAFIGLTVSIIIMSALIGGNFSIKSEVVVFSDLSQKEWKPLLEQLNETGAFKYTKYNEEDAIQRVREKKSELAVELKRDGANLIIATNSQNTDLVQYEVMSVYQNLKRNENVLQQASTMPTVNVQQLEKQLDSLSDYNVFKTKQETFTAQDSFVYDASLYSLFGFSLFFVIYTIAFNVVTILTEKKEGVWNRILISPTKKWEMYTGNLLYSFLTGYVQVALVFCVFRFGLDIEFHGAFGKTLIILIPYVFCIIAFSLFVAALVKNLQQFNVAISLVSVSMAMLGGAYWPIEVVTSSFMLLLAKFTPIYYGMEALKGAVIYGYDWNQIAYPIAMMCLVGVVLIGLGIKIIDRKN
ncbi:ABC transporter permease [Bacillus massiliigorillae]|uniref:ABC transporter permease n=1 Tax=Bacillus massiliigorillae TaxID=1243664 RepID=UPI0003A25DA8|nr:ABC transporter permease [Bacillus massiliigorillae]